MSSHPIQPLEVTADGVLHFKPNKIVLYLLDNGGIDMNALAKLNFPAEDREQFAQLIGYSHRGYGELSYVTRKTYLAAAKMYEDGKK